MANTERHASHSPAADGQNWTSAQAYILACFCLALGVALGYLFRGSASPVIQTVQASAAVNGSAPQGESRQPQLTPEQQKAMVDQAVAPLLTTLKTNPDDFNTIVQVANLYYDGRQYPVGLHRYARRRDCDDDRGSRRHRCHRYLAPPFLHDYGGMGACVHGANSPARRGQAMDHAGRSSYRAMGR